MLPPPSRARRAALVAAGGLGRAVLGLGCLLLIATLVPGLLGYQRFVVVGGSMEPQIHRGSLVFDEVVPVARLGIGDVITYVPPGHSDPVTHRRIVGRELDRGKWVFRTQGDNNSRRTCGRSRSTGRRRPGSRSRCPTPATSSCCSPPPRPGSSCWSSPPWYWPC